MSQATTSTGTQQRPAVTGKAKVLRPVGTVGLSCNRVGEISINGKAYYCQCLAGTYQLFGRDERRGVNTLYTLPADLSSCDCPDFRYRADEREDHRCKHQKAIAALVAAGKLPELQTVALAS